MFVDDFALKARIYRMQYREMSAMRSTHHIHVFVHKGDTVVERYLVLSVQVRQVHLRETKTKETR